MGTAELVARDSRRALSLAGDLAACRTSKDLEGPLLAMPQLIGADAFGSGELHFHSPRAAIDILPQLAYPELFDAGTLAFYAAHWKEHPGLARLVSGPERQPMRLSDLLSQRRLRRLPLHSGYRQLGMQGELILQVHWKPGQIACITAHRAGRDFGRRELALIETLAPHVAAARGRIAIGRVAERSRKLLERSLEALGSLAVLLDGNGRIAACGERARHVLRDWFGPSPATDRLPSELEEWIEQRRRSPDPAPLVRAASGRRLEVRLASAGTDDAEMLLLNERRTQRPEAADLERGLPLTRRQAEVLALVAEGLTDAAIAHELGISRRTVGRHVEQILARLHVPTRTAAAAVALGPDYAWR